MSLLKKLIPLLFLPVVSCRSVPGDTVAEQRTHIDDWEQETLQMLYKQDPGARDIIAKAPAYLAIDQHLVKIPFLGTGRGYGVLVDRTTDQRLYVTLDRLDMGGGLGARNLRVVLVIHDPKLLKNAGEASRWSFGGSAEASSKSDSKSGGGLNSQRARYTIYELTDEGVSVTWTIYAIRLSPNSALN